MQTAGHPCSAGSITLFVFGNQNIGMVSLNAVAVRPAAKNYFENILLKLH